ncbi:MAG: hypothetical protein K6C98_08700 [Treponema sp.]|nr:hypothetical protein [Treponema sp.]
MPGLSQLKKFNSDMLSLGDEATVRATRGEKPVKVDIPNSIPDVNDSEDFVLGMPMKEVVKEEAPVQEDFSDITGVGAPSQEPSSSKEESSEPTASSAPDMSDLLNMGMAMGGGDDGNGGDEGMPDLSMFEEEAEPEPEPEPEEIPISDLGLDALLAGAGFDEPEPEPEAEAEPEAQPDLQDLSSSLDGLADISELDIPKENQAEPEAFTEPAVEEPLPDMPTDSFDLGNIPDMPDFGDFGATPAAEPEEDLPNLELAEKQPENAVEPESEPEPEPAKPAKKAFDVSDIEDLNLDDIPEVEINPFKMKMGRQSLFAEKPEDDYFDEFDLSGGFDDDEETNIHPELKSNKKPEPAKEKTADVPEASAEGNNIEENGELGDVVDDIPIEDITPNDEPLAAAEEVPENVGDAGEQEAAPSLDDLSLDDLSLDGLDMGDSAEAGEPAAESEEPASDDGAVEADVSADEPLSADTFNLDDMDFGGAEETPAEEAPAEEEAIEEPLADEVPSDDAQTSEGAETVPADDFSLGDLNLDDMDFDAAEPAAEVSTDEPASEEGTVEEASAEEVPAEEVPSDEVPAEDALSDEMPSLDDLTAEGTEEPAAEEETPSESAPADDFSLGDLNLDDMSLDEPPAEDVAAESSSDDAVADESLGSEDAEIPSEEPSTADLFNLDDMDKPAGENLDDAADSGEELSMPDYTDAVAEEVGDDLDLDSLNTGIEESDEPVEAFDTTGMEDMDFGISDTDSQISDDDFLGGDDEDFVIPGITDVADISEQPKPAKKSAPEPAPKKEEKKSDLDEPDFTEALPGEELPPNTLSDAQYKVFLKNFSEYPLNVRLAFENLIVQDEFTDDAEFEVIEKILNKAPARQVASMLEKMLDISIPVPRDFEHRSAEEYEAYKKSLSYQLRNRIIPGFIVGCAMILVGIGLFNFGKNCIYKPLKANSLYKQGYALLKAEEYPQSEIKFDEAVKYRLSRGWFFNYARGYREHKQYQRAEKMYQNILMCFRHDKEAGLEYADMELNDLVNYERAEEIVRREVLDYHINDADGILELGDIYLEWGTEKDPEKLELAREQYASLMQLYKPNSIYLARMMRYFIRSDKLRQVLEIRQNFDENKEKSLPPEDWTELSGYLLNKYYGPLPASQEYLRFQIDGLRRLLLTAAHANSANPVALYNLSKYYVLSNENERIEPTLKNTLKTFNAASSLKRRDIYKYIDTYKLLGEYYEANGEHVQAQEQYAEGISLYTQERDNAGFEGNKDIGKLYEDMADLKYFISADYDDALKNYMSSVELENDSPQIRYRIGFIQYNNDNLAEALGSFMKAGDGNVKETNLMLAMANTLSLRGDDYAAEGYYNQLVQRLDQEVLERQMVFPQVNDSDYDIVNTYLSAANNYGVSLYRLAKRTGNSSLNAKSIVQFQQSVRAWDALTRNQNTLLRLGGTNLAEQNIKYVTHNFSEYEPAIYTEIPKTLTDNER